MQIRIAIRPFRSLFLVAGLLATCLPASPAWALFTPTVFSESLYGCGFGSTCQNASGPGIATPESVALDYSSQVSDDFLSLSGKAQTNGGLSPAVDLALSWTSSSHTLGLTGGGEAQILYGFRADYTGSGAPPVSTVPLVFIYQLGTHLNATGTGVAESYAELTLDGTGIATASGLYNPNVPPIDPGGSASGAVLRNLPADVEHVLALSAFGSITAFPGSSATPSLFSASIVAGADPLIQFAPGFAYADQYQIVLEPGSLQINPDFVRSPIPEPATSILLGAGLVVAALRRRRGRA